MPNYSRKSAIKKVMRQQHVTREIATELVDKALEAIKGQIKKCLNSSKTN